MGRGMILGLIDPAWIAVAAVVVITIVGVTRLQAARESSYPIVTPAALSNCSEQGFDPGGQLGECFSGHVLALRSRERRALLLDDPCFNWGDITSSNGIVVVVADRSATTGSGCGGTWRRVRAVLTGLWRGRATVSADGRDLRTGRTERFLIRIQVG